MHIGYAQAQRSAYNHNTGLDRINELLPTGSRLWGRANPRDPSAFFWGDGVPICIS
jgi:hypothetical protein